MNAWTRSRWRESPKYAGETIGFMQLLVEQYSFVTDISLSLSWSWSPGFERWCLTQLMAVNAMPYHAMPCYHHTIATRTARWRKGLILGLPLYPTSMDYSYTIPFVCWLLVDDDAHQEPSDLSLPVVNLTDNYGLRTPGYMTFNWHLLAGQRFFEMTRRFPLSISNGWMNTELERRKIPPQEEWTIPSIHTRHPSQTLSVPKMRPFHPPSHSHHHPFQTPTPQRNPA